MGVVIAVRIIPPGLRRPFMIITTMRQGIGIVCFSIAAACIYGIAHDMVTAHVCVEYFSIGHPTIIADAGPTELALIWGVIATWWVGLLLGVPLALCSRLGAEPRRTVHDLVRPVLMLLACMAIGSAALGVVGWALARAGAVFLIEPLASRVPSDCHVAFLADLWAHLGAYGIGFVGGIVLCIATVRARNRARRGQGEEARQDQGP